MTPMSNIANDMQAKIRASFFILIQNCVELMEVEKSVSGTSADTATEASADTAVVASNALFADERRALIRQAAALDKPSDEAQRAAQTAELQKMRTTLLTSFRSINILKAYLVLVISWLWRHIYQQLAENMAFKLPADGNPLFSKHLAFLLRDRDGNDLSEANNEAMKFFMSLMPLRMTSARYNDYIKDAFHIMDYKLTTNDMSDYMSLFYPLDGCTDDGILDEVKHVLNAVWEADMTQLSPDELDKTHMRVIACRQTVTDAAVRLCGLFDTVNALLILQEDPDCVAALLREPDARAMLDRYQSGQLSQDFNLRLDRALHAEMKKIDMDLFNNADVITDDDWLRITRMFYESALDYLRIPAPNTSIDQSMRMSTDEFLTLFLVYLEQCCAALPPQRRRFVRQTFLRYLPYPYDFDTYKQYFLNTYDSLDKKNRGLMSYFVAKLAKNESEEQDADRDI